jgi:hypothetical protein
MPCHVICLIAFHLSFPVQEGATPLHFAGCHDSGGAAVAAALLAAGGNATAATCGGLTPLHTAAMADAAAVATLLMRAGGDPNAREQKYGDAPLHIAAGRSSVDCALALLAGGADDTQRNDAGLTPAAEALCTGGSEAVFRALCPSRRQVAATWRLALDAAGIEAPSLGRAGGLSDGALPPNVADTLQRAAIRALAAASSQHPPQPGRMSGIRGVLRGCAMLRGATSAAPQALPDHVACTICLSAPRDVRLTACGHAAACSGCFAQIVYGRPVRTGARCPLCRTPVPPGAFSVAQLPEDAAADVARPTRKRRRSDDDADAAAAAAAAALAAAVGPEFDAASVVPEHKEHAEILMQLGMEVLYS